jgi:excisionase family DNA binding protein
MFKKKLGITVCEAAAMVSVSELTMRRKIWAGEVRAEKVGGRVLVPIDEVRRLVGLSREGSKKPSHSEGSAV